MAQSCPTPDASPDAQLELKKRARRRLVGAAALALLAAIVLPMVMDHEPKQPAQDIQIRIPSQDRQDGGGFTSRILPAKPAATPLPPVESVAEAPPPPPKAEEARSAVPGADSAGEQWAVQLGAYKDAGNVRMLTAKIRQMGLPSYTEEFESPQGVRTRVRAGPFPSRDAAEKAQARIRAIGVSGPVAPK
ncbi:MAG: SPOR domain-containing protein [Candidatus Nitricoxidivorans perseverans]|uniref:SPOR domain-containing protein n=1 Tax=Candidatus Nitricoxidivorans perseverans TaxID=2975601 RepID=A0AA49FMN0_9PROT|nr:MAG: SPOR domain-containing protein [Candidatus Nitricoxidivorans perseverans]